MINITSKVILVAVAVAVSAFLLVNGVAAGNPHGDTRPGWGHGDKNHEHTGPPGLTVRPNP